MSFNNYARKVLNPQLPLLERRSALKSCFQRFTRLSGERYTAVTTRYEARFHCTGRHSTEDGIVKALTTLAAERNLILEKLRDFERKRMAEKRSGRRTLSRSEKKELKEVGSHVLT